MLEPEDRSRGPVAHVVDPLLHGCGLSERPAVAGRSIQRVDVLGREAGAVHAASEPRLPTGVGASVDVLDAHPVDVVDVRAAIFRRPVADAPLSGGPDREAVGDDGRLDRDVRIDLIEAPVGDRARRRSLTHRLARDDPDRAGGGVPAVASRLRPAQHVDSLDVEELRELPDRGVHVDLVAVDRDRRRRRGGEVAEPDPADEERRVRGREGRADLEVRREGSDVRQGVGTDRFEVFLVEGDDRNVLVEVRSIAAFADDDHLFDPVEEIVFGSCADRYEEGDERDHDPKNRTRGARRHPASLAQRNSHRRPGKGPGVGYGKRAGRSVRRPVEPSGPGTRRASATSTPLAAPIRIAFEIPRASIARSHAKHVSSSSTIA